MTLDRLFLLDRRSIPWLDGLRALAIILVVVQHVADRTFNYLSGSVPFAQLDGALLIKLLTGYGWSGIYLFFIISGFLVGGSVVLEIRKDAFRWRSFAFKRFFRVYIPAVVFLTAYALTKPHDLFPRGDIFGSLGLHNYLFIMNYTGDAYLGHYWSLAVEEHFYITLPIAGLCLAPLIRRYPLHIVGKSFLVAALLFALFRLILTQTGAIQNPLDLFLLSHWQFDYFAIGIALRIYYENRESRPVTPPPVPGGVLLLCFFATLMALSLLAGISEGNTLLENHGHNAKVDGFLLFMNLVVMGALVFLSSTGTAGRVFSYKWLRVVAAISFSTYIVHLPVIVNTYFLLPPLRELGGEGQSVTYLMAIAVGLMTTLGAGFLFYITVERPVLLLRDLITERWASSH